MELKKPGSARQHRLLFRGSMVIGLLLLAAMVAVYFIITGHYADLETRKTVETLLNVAFIDGILYSVTFWFVCALNRPHLAKIFSRRS